jgi:hypothetical protein
MTSGRNWARMGWTLALCAALGLAGCAIRPSVRAYDPWTAEQAEVDVALNQVEGVLRMQQYRLRSERMWTGGITLVVGVALESFLLAGAGTNTCFTDPTPENDCIAEVALAVGAAGGLVGSGLTSLILQTEGELDLEGYLHTDAETPEQRRVMLEYGYQLLERPDLEGGNVIHQVGSGLLLGVGLALVTIPTLLPNDQKTSGYTIAGSVGIGLGVFWAIAATVFRHPRVYDVSVSPSVSQNSALLSLQGRF